MALNPKLGSYLLCYQHKGACPKSAGRLITLSASCASILSMVLCMGGSHLNCLLLLTFSFPFDITTYENCIVRVASSNYTRIMNNKSNTHTTTLIDVHNRMKHANTRNNNVIPSNNNVMLKILFHYTTKSL